MHDAACDLQTISPYDLCNAVITLPDANYTTSAIDKRMTDRDGKAVTVTFERQLFVHGKKSRYVWHAVSTRFE
jgi:hypothetical protein